MILDLVSERCWWYFSFKIPRRTSEIIILRFSSRLGLRRCFWVILSHCWGHPYNLSIWSRPRWPPGALIFQSFNSTSVHYDQLSDSFWIWMINLITSPRTLSWSRFTGWSISSNPVRPGVSYSSLCSTSCHCVPCYKKKKKVWIYRYIKVIYCEFCIM